MLIFVCFTAGAFTGRALERSQRMAFESRRTLVAHASSERLGDSRLNHVLKNKTAAATYLIELIQEDLAPPAAASAAGGAGGLDASTMAAMQGRLDSVVTLLQQNADWCHMRELFVQLQRGVYMSSMPLTDLASTFTRFPEQGATVHFDNCPRWLHVDSNILLLCLEEGFSNAHKYRAHAEPFVVSARLIAAGADAAAANMAPAGAGAGAGAWAAASPRSRARAGSAAEPCRLHVALDNANAKGLRALSHDECEAVLREGVKGPRLEAEYSSMSSRSLLSPPRCVERVGLLDTIAATQYSRITPSQTISPPLSTTTVVYEPLLLPSMPNYHPLS